MLQFEWDEEKEWSNYLKHWIRFNDAQMIWSDPYADEFYDDTHSLIEERFIRRGNHPTKGLLVVVFTERENTIRIISARKATKNEKEDYEEGI